MIRYRWIRSFGLVPVVLCFIATSTTAQDSQHQFANEKIVSLESELEEAQQASSSARQKLAIRRVIRECDELLEKNKSSPNRYEVLDILFRAQQQLIGLDDSTTNRRAILDTARQLAAAPNEYAAIRLDADLLVSQAELAQQGVDQRARADALRPLIERYKDTTVEAKVIRITMLMALELGDARMVSQMSEVIAERFAGDSEMINFQRDKLAGQVFGAPFIGRFERSDGKIMSFPMDCLGKTTALYFWSQDNNGKDDLKALAVAWEKLKAESDAADRFQFVSFNLDDLPDAGEGILRELGLDWPALRLPGGRDNSTYKTYARVDPITLTMSPSGYTAMFMSGGGGSGRGYDRDLQSALAREWTKPRYTSQYQSLLAGDFLVLDLLGDFDPTMPPEWRAMQKSGLVEAEALTRTAKSVPEDKLRAIQSCFIDPPLRYRTSFDQVRANYEKAESLCGKAISEHPEANDLWIVRNRRIIALMALWKLDGDRNRFAAAVEEAKLAVAKGYPPGTDVVARFCLAREAFRADDIAADAVISKFVEDSGGPLAPGPAIAAASLLALDVGDRRLHEKYRLVTLDKYSDHPACWTAVSFMVDRYHRYWLYHPPFTAGWTYDRRQGHFLAIGQPEEAHRTLRTEFKALDGGTFRIPEDSGGKWTVISFAKDAKAIAFPRGTTEYLKSRPFEDVNLIATVFSDDAAAIGAELNERNVPDEFPTMLVPGGIKNPIVHKLGILDEDERPNFVILRPDGSIAVTLSGLTMSAQHGDVIQNVIECHDEKAVDEALASGDLEEAKRLAFAFAPIDETIATDQKKKPANKISNPHLRSRAKVYTAMKNWEAAFKDAQEAYLEVNSRAGWLSMRTDELDEIEMLKATINRLRELEE